MSYSQTFQWALTLTGVHQDAALEGIKVLPIVEYILYAHDTSAEDNNHIHVFLRTTKRVSVVQLKTELKDYMQSIQYIDQVKSSVGYRNYIMDKHANGFTVDAHGNIPPIVHAALSSATGSTKGFDNKTNQMSCDYKLANGLYKNRDEAIADYKERSSQAWIFRNPAVMSAINRLYPACDRKRKFELCDYNYPPLDFSNNKTKILVGPTNMGKTQYAIAHFKHPLVVTNKQGWAAYDPDLHDGAVVDDMTFNKNNPVEMLHMLDMREPATLRILYGIVTIPAEFPRIFTCNHESLFWPENAAPATMEAYKTRSEVITFPFNIKLYGGQTKKLKITEPKLQLQTNLHERLFGAGSPLASEENSDEESEHSDEPECGEASTSRA